MKPMVKPIQVNICLTSFLLKVCKTRVQENQVGLKLNRTHQLMFYAVDVNLMGENIDTIRNNTETLIDTNYNAGLEENAEKAKYVLLSHQQNAEQNHDIKIAN
jgi:hypothetical protein